MARAGANFYTFATLTAQFLHIAPQKPRRAHARPWIHVDMDRTVPRAAGTVRAARAPASNPHTARQPTTLVPPIHPAQASCEKSENESCDAIPSSAPAVAGPPPVRRSKFLRACGAQLLHFYTFRGHRAHMCTFTHLLPNRHSFTLPPPYGKDPARLAMSRAMAEHRRLYLRC